MTLVRWSPLRDMILIQDEMNRLFNNYAAAHDDQPGSVVWHPVVDIEETGDDIVVHAEIPGICKEDIKLSIQDNVLTISGEKKREEEKKDANYHRVERSYGSFQRSFSLPGNVAADKVKASYKDGVLTIVLPKAEEAKPKEIPVAVK